MDDVANMSPARLNAVSSIEVMQWRRTANDPSEYIVREGLTTQFLPVDQWRPAERIADAFQLVAKMRERGFGFGMWHALDESTVVHFEQLGSRGELTTASGDTDALAITRAAILAVRANRTPTRKVAEYFVRNPKAIGDLAASLDEEPEDWPDERNDSTSQS